ncbi:ABC transporter permease subunit [Bacillus salacetis]|uniref:ABC transporter permease subunit n=1 Tax=Bacillus salacetis TaxID=2315464 RepID=UPI003BA077AA
MYRMIAKKIALPILILSGLLVVSFLVPVVYPHYDEIINYLTDENGKIIAAPPFTAGEMPPAGSDRLGRNLLLLLLAGAKFTLIAALAIALIRILAGFIAGVIYAFLPSSLGRFIKNLGEAFQYIPLVIIVFAMLAPLENPFQESILPSNQYFIIQVIAIALVTIPSFAVYVGEELKLFMQNEFVEVSRSMGAGRFHIFRRHLLPQLRRHSIVLFSEQVSLALSLLIQLGILLMALGGLKIADFAFGELDPYNPVYFSNTNEWAATISMNINQIFTTPSLVLVPLTLFAVAILCVNSISASLRKVLIENEIPLGRTKKQEQASQPSTVVSKDSFTFKQ